MSFTASLSLSKQESKPTITNNINVYPTGGVKTNGVVHAKMPTTRRPTMTRSMSQRQLPPTTTTTQMASAPPVEEPPAIPTTLAEQPPEEKQLEDYPPAPTPVGYQDVATQTEPVIEQEAITTQRIQLFEKTLLQILVDMFGSDKTLLKHMLEPTDKIILKASKLLVLISILTGSEAIHLSMEPMIKGCCVGSTAHQDVIPVRITKILVNDVDFFINYNELYNLFAKYNIYIDRCFIVESETVKV